NGRLAHLMGIHRPADRRVETMTLHEGGWFSSDQGQLVVIDQAAARLLKESDPDNEDAPSAHVGDSFDLPGPGGKLRVTIVGIVHKPAFFAAHVQTLYLPIRTLQRFVDSKNPAQITRILIELKE